MTHRLLISYLALAAIILAALMIPLGITFSTSQERDLLSRVERDARTLAALGLSSFPRPSEPEQNRLRETAAQYERENAGHAVIFVDDRAMRVAYATTSPASRQRFADDPGVAAALDDGVVSTGEGPGSNGGWLWVTAPINANGGNAGAVRVSVPRSDLNEAVREFWLILLAIAAVMMTAVALLGLLLARSVGRPLARLNSAAQAIGKGNFSVRASDGDGPTEVREVAESFDTMAARLENMIESQRGFASDASHQLRTPLAAIHLRLENAIEVLDGSPARTDVEAALSEASRLNEMVSGLLVLARSERSNNPAQPVDVLNTVGSRVGFHQELAQASGIKLRASCGPLWAYAQPNALEQILDNLIENAIAASPRGSEINVTAALTGGMVELHVIDQGPGMSPEDRASAFERFWSRRATNDSSGTGLGLAIVRRLAEASNGSAELWASKAGGVDAVVRLAPAPDPAKGNAEPAHNSEESSSPA